ncbi:RHS repeat domain-containing protein [Patescibacteria group bacterium]
MKLLVITSFVILALMIFPSSVFAEGTFYYIHQDHLSSTAMVSDEQGDIVSKQTYYPYGSVRGTQGTLPTERQYTSQVSDADQTGLYYYNARYYDPLIGKFTQADTQGGPNRYMYVSNNPIRYIDPSGHQLDARSEGSYFKLGRIRGRSGGAPKPGNASSDGVDQQVDEGEGVVEQVANTAVAFFVPQGEELFTCFTPGECAHPAEIEQAQDDPDGESESLKDQLNEELSAEEKKANREAWQALFFGEEPPDVGEGFDFDELKISLDEFADDFERGWDNTVFDIRMKWYGSPTEEVWNDMRYWLWKYSQKLQFWKGTCLEGQDCIPEWAQDTAGEFIEEKFNDPIEDATTPGP